MKKSINEYLNKRIGEIDQNALIEFGNEPSALQIFNVVRGFEKEAFSIIYYDKNDYEFIYISNRDKLVGYYLKTGLNIKYRTNCTLAFCQMLHEKFEGIDEILTFNRYQNLLRSTLERDGIITYSNQKYSLMNGKIVLMKTEKGLAFIPFISKLELYNSIFKGRKYQDKIDENKVYLMFNQDTNLIKIGRSKKTSYRERTLQSKEPKIALICSWIAPKEVEKELHKKYKHKRDRGEWFNLNPRDLKEINDFMKGYKKIESCA